MIKLTENSVPCPRPSLKFTLRLMCPLCGQTRLQAANRFFEFSLGCPKCAYKFEREDGYFSGSPWMVGYPIVGISLLVISLVLKFIKPDTSVYFLITAGFFLGALLSVIGFPWFRAIWMHADLWLNPLTSNDHQLFKATILADEKH